MPTTRPSSFVCTFPECVHHPRPAAPEAAPAEAPKAPRRRPAKAKATEAVAK